MPFARSLVGSEVPFGTNFLNVPGDTKYRRSKFISVYAKSSLSEQTTPVGSPLSDTISSLPCFDQIFKFSQRINEGNETKRIKRSEKREQQCFAPKLPPHTLFSLQFMSFASFYVVPLCLKKSFSFLLFRSNIR